MTLTLVTAPSDLVTLDEVKAHLRVDIDDEDPLIGGLIQGAIAYLDGYRGVLGRAIMPQTWRQTFTCAGPYRLAMPDVSTFTATVGGNAAPGTLSGDAMGPVVTLDASSPDGATIEFTCALPVQQLPAVRMAVLLLIGNWYQHRESVGERGQEIPMGFEMLISSMRWRSV